MADSLGNFLCPRLSISAPAYSGAAVTPSDSTDLPNTARFVHVAGTGGTIAVTFAGMTSGTHVGIYVAQGGVFEGLITRIWSTGTTATSVIALY